MRNQRPSPTARQVIALSLVFACLTGQSRLGAAESAGTQFTHTFYLVRHGAYDPAARADPEKGPGLTPLGIAQARLIASRLHGLPARFDSITSSTMTRARETAAVMRETLTDIPMRQTAFLSECTPPTLNAEVAKESDPKEAAECARRLNEAFKRLFVPATGAARSDVVVCHGNVIRYFVMKALGVETGMWIRMSVAHASLTVIRVRADGSMTVLAVGDVGHLPPNLQSGTGNGDPELVVSNAVQAGMSYESGTRGINARAR
jgi:serine/threonine-protein phosphatase PGAM5